MDENEQPCIKKVIFLFLAQDQDYIGKLQEKKGPGALEYEAVICKNLSMNPCATRNERKLTTNRRFSLGNKETSVRCSQILEKRRGLWHQMVRSSKILQKKQGVMASNLMDVKNIQKLDLEA
jgi:hypothetical protein